MKTDKTKRNEKKDLFFLPFRIISPETCDNFVASLTKLVSSRPRDLSVGNPYAILLERDFGRDAQRVCQASRKVSDESLGRDETSFVTRLATKLSQVTVNFIVNTVQKLFLYCKSVAISDNCGHQ